MNICFVTPRFPFPITKGDTLRAYNQIRELGRTHDVHLIAGSEGPVPDASLRELQQHCRSVDVVRIGRARSFATVATLGLGSRLPLQVLYFLAPELRARVERAVKREAFDIIHAMTIRVAPAVFGTHGVPVVVDFMDSFAANISTRRALAGPVARRVYDLELERVTAYERDVARRAAGGFVIAELDRDAIGDPGLAIIPNGVDRETFRFHAGERDAATLIFTGNMGYGPNVDAVTWFAAECWPALAARHPGLRFQIVGARPAPAVSALTRMPGIEVTGRVDSMVPYLHRATVAVCPIRCGSGMQNKLLEAMATGAPVVTTEFANRGIGAVPNRDLLTAADAPAFVEAVSQLLANPDLRARQAAAAQTWVDATYGWARHADALVQLYARAITATRARPLGKAG
jgi:sugar transferase (PEP-CTERM/EpsH1 system associated)